MSTTTLTTELSNGLSPTMPLDEVAQRLLENIQHYTNDWVQQGDHYRELLAAAPLGSDQDTVALFYHFSFAERAKELLLLWRNVLFEHLKGRVLQSDNRRTTADVEQHWQQSVAVLRGAAAELHDWVEQELNALRNLSTSPRRLERWRLQTDPWPVYREQMTQIAQQAQELIENAGEGCRHVAIFDRIEALLLNNARQYVKDVETMIVTTDDTLDKMADAKVGTSLTLINRLTSMEAGIQPTDASAELKTRLDALVGELPTRWSAIVQAQSGILLRTDIQLARWVARWLEGEAMPLLYEIWELSGQAHDGFTMSFANLRNRLQLLGDQENFNYVDHTYPLVRYTQSLSTLREDMATHFSTLRERLDDQFFLSNVYQTERPFLPAAMQLTVRQIDQTSGRLASGISELLGGVGARIRRLVTQVEQEEGMSYAEKTTRYIEHRTPAADSSTYNSIFVTKGFVGSSFATGREDDMAQIDRIFKQWQRGYRGAVLLTGRRLCGKTFFGEWVAKKYFTDHFIRLQAGQESRIQGRKLAGTQDLGAVLDFVKKYAFPLRPLIWIDDLELWQDANHSFYANVRALMEFTDRHATQCFVLVATNQWAFHNLQLALQLDRAFQATISLNTMSAHSITHALLIRHGATHRKLVDQRTGAMLLPADFGDLARRISRAAHGNIGEALMWWTSSVVINTDRTVYIDFADKHNLPRHPDPDSRLLLSEILWQKKTYEYRLRKQFGPAFGERYLHLVRRMLGMGLLNRLADGGLEINEAAVNATAGFLRQ